MKKSALVIFDAPLYSPFKDEPSFRVKQLATHLFEKHTLSFQEMTDFPKQLRDALEEKYCILPFSVKKKIVSDVDSTEKYLFELNDGLCIEAVLLCDEKERYTICISSQVGCRMGCTFCNTGRMGLQRNLEWYEIIGQYYFFAAMIKKAFNIVFMGMGEPLDNREEVEKTVRILTDKSMFAISPQRITISTCGLIDQLVDFAGKFPRIQFAISLNTASNDNRVKIMPITRQYPVRSIIEGIKRVYKITGKRITLEYVMISGSTMNRDDILALSQFPKDKVLINCIPINPWEESYTRPEEDEIRQFLEQLTAKGFKVTRRYRRGDDIMAACGQLYWETDSTTI